MWRTFEKKSYRIGPQSSKILQSCLGFVDPPQLKAQPGLAPSHKRYVCKTRETYRCNLSLENFASYEVFFYFYILPYDKPPFQGDVLYCIFFWSIRVTSKNWCAVPKKPGYFLYMGSLVHLNKASKALKKCAFGGPWKSLTPLVYKFHHFSRVYPHPKGVPPFFTMVATTSRSSRS